MSESMNAHFNLAAPLRAAGLRVTFARTATLQVLTSAPHSSADAIHAAVREMGGSVSKQAIYDVLHTLTGAGILRAVQLDGRSVLYELQKNDNHHHMVCTSCSRFLDVPCAIGHSPCLTPCESHGFELEIADVIYRGVCPECREKA
ncbi:Fur family transcriptional regulator [Dermabacteraceae bacterium P7074]